MGVKVLPEAHVVRVLNDVENVLYLISVIILSPCLILLLLFVIAPISAIALNNNNIWNKFRRLNIVIFKITKYIYRPLSVDKSLVVPRFIIFGFVTPVYYTYHLLAFAILIAVYSLHQFWQITFLSSQQMADCDEDMLLRATTNTTECIVLSVRSIQASTAVVSLIAAIIFVHLFVLEIFLKFSGGIGSVRLARSKNGGIRLIRVIITIIVQIIIIIVGRTIFIAYFVTADYGEDTNISLFDRGGWFTMSLLIDDISFVMLTPWFMFERIKKKKTQGTTEGKGVIEGKDTQEEMETALVNPDVDHATIDDV